jgi:hypothetical protein
MRKIWTTCLITGLTVTSLAVVCAAKEAETRTIAPHGSRAIYLGERLDGLGLRQLGPPKTATTSGAIDVYNVWTSFTDIDIRSNLELTGHSYVLCSNIDDSIFYGHLIYSFLDFIEVRVVYNWSIADRLTATTFFNLNNGPGFFLLVDEFDIRDFRDGYYKVKARYTVTGGGSGSGKESCFFDVLDCR